MRELGRNLGVMMRSSWQADRFRSIGALASTALVPVTRPLRAVGLALLADGVVGGDRQRAVIGALVAAGLTAANRILDWASLTVRMRLRENTILFLDQRVMELAAGVPGLEHHERPDYQDHLEVLRAERGHLVNPFMPIAWTLAAIIQLVTTVIVLARLHPVLALLPLGGVPSVAIALRVEGARQRLRDEQAEAVRLRAHLLGLATQPASGKEVRVFGVADELAARYRASFADSERRFTRFNLLSGFALSAGWMMFALTYMAAVAFVAARVLDGTLSIGAMVLTLSMGAQMNSQLSELVSNFSWFSMTAHAISRYRWLRDYARDVHAAIRPSEPVPVPERLRSGITFSGVHFTYPGTSVPVLNGVDLHIPAGRTIAIVGENGAGKTTMVKLLCRFYEPTAGAIEADGIDLRRFDVEEWRSRLSAGFQDFAQLQLVAQESVGVGHLGLIESEPAVAGALSRAAAHDIPGALPQGLATQLGREFDDGVELSLGQWQKIALGRAMMRERPLVLALDEPTASLDSHTEHALFDRFAGAARRVAEKTGAITILVSHRFSTVRMADVIVVVAGGRLVEVGSHTDLMARGGLYADLYRLQARGYQ